ncbi:hypothetical protein BAE44_0016455 [Dichanthelium oligosanthes]|uniref:Uncharacterized protein n=1 Tax=Dichanthelium oligosanthes TaxID=888268 RepID=A0A1E5VBY1_9POAL|nr:hypothetical protein BAE44_0016455 [Dichanthelium oligosanthes]
MFVVGASYVSLIQSMTARCVLPYVSMVCEIAGDGALLCGVEIQLPSIGPFCHPRQVFFWASVQSNPSAAHEQAAFQAICYLQSVYLLSYYPKTASCCRRVHYHLLRPQVVHIAVYV